MLTTFWKSVPPAGYADIRLDQQRLNVIPRIVVNFRRPKHLGNAPEKRLARAFESLA